MASGVINIFRNQITPVVTGCTGIGTSTSQLFVKNFEKDGAPGILQIGLTNVVGTFTTLQFNLEWSPTNSAGQYFETVGTWTPLTNGTGFFPISESGFFRLNCTSFSGGTSTDVSATVGLPAGSVSGGGGSGGNVTLVGSTITLPVSIAGTVAATQSGTWTVQQGSAPWSQNLTQLNSVALASPTAWGTAASGNVIGVNAELFAGSTALTATGTSLNVNITGGSSSGTQYADNAASGAAPTGTLSMGWDSTNSKVRALKVDASQNLDVNVQAIGTVTVTGTVAATQSGTWTVQQGGAPWSQNLTQLNSIALGSPSAYGTSPGAVNVPGVNAFITNTPAVTLASTTVTNTVAENLTQLNGVALGSPTAWGTAASGNVIGVNAELFAGNNALSTTLAGSPAVQALNVFVTNPTSSVVTGTVTANQGGAPWSVTFPSAQHVIVDSGAITVSGSVSVSNFPSTFGVTQSTNPWTVAWTNPQHVIVDSGGGGGTQYTDGSAQPSGSPPQLIGTAALGFDGTNVWALRLDGSKNLKVAVQNAVTVNGTVAVTQSTNPWSVTFPSPQHVIVDSGGSGSSGTSNTSLAVWNSGTTANTTAVILSNNFSYETVVVELAQTSTLAAGAITFEGSINNSDWFTVVVTQLAPNPLTGGLGGAQISLPYTLQASTNVFFGINVAGINYLRARLSTAISGTGQVTIEYAAQSLTGQNPVTIVGQPNINCQQGTTPWTVAGTTIQGGVNSTANAPVKIGGPFNSTQPTVTTGQTVEAQFTQRGALIVATGVDAFTVAVSGTVAVNVNSIPTVNVSIAQQQPLVSTLNSTSTLLGIGSIFTGIFESVANYSAIFITIATNVNGTLEVDWAGQGGGPASSTDIFPVTGGVGFEIALNPHWAAFRVQYTNGGVAQGSFNLQSRFYPTAQAFPRALTQAGNFKVAVQEGTVTANQGGAPWSQNLTQLNSVALASPTAWGTAASGNVIGVNSELFAGSTALTATGSSLNVNITGGSSSGTQYADNAASGATPTGTLAMLWDSTNSKVRATKADASQNMLVALGAAIPAGTNVIGHVITDSGSTTVVTGTVAVTQSTSPWVVSGTVTANQGGAPWSQNLVQLNSVALGSPTAWGTAASGNVIGVNAELFAGNTALTTTSFGSPAVQGLNTYIINPVTITGTIAENLTQLDGIALTAPSAFGVAPPASGSPPTTSVIGTNSSIFAGTAPLSATLAGSPPVQALNTYVVNPVSVSGLVTAVQGNPPWAVTLASTTVTGTVAVTQSTNPWVVTQSPATSGGCLTNVQQVLTTSAQVKSSAGQLYGYKIFNPNTYVVYIFWYNTTTAPTIGSTTNLIDEIGIPAGAAANFADCNGTAYSAGIYVAVSQSATGSSAPATGLVITSEYK